MINRNFNINKVDIFIIINKKMVESFTKGMIFAFFLRVATLRAMKWPTTSSTSSNKI